MSWFVSPVMSMTPAFDAAGTVDHASIQPENKRTPPLGLPDQTKPTWKAALEREAAF